MSGAEWPENARGPFFGSRSALFEKMSKIESGKNLVTLLRPGTCAESPENAREQVFGSRSALFEKMSKMDPEKNWLRFWDILGSQVQNDLKTHGNRFLG